MGATSPPQDPLAAGNGDYTLGDLERFERLRDAGHEIPEDAAAVMQRFAPVYARLAAQMREHQPRIDAVHRMPAALRRRYEHRTLRSLRNDPLVSAYTRQVGASQSQTASCRSREHRPGATRRASSSSSSSSSDPGDPDGEPHHRGPRHISRAITAFLAEVVA